MKLIYQFLNILKYKGIFDALVLEHISYLIIVSSLVVLY